MRASRYSLLLAATILMMLSGCSDTYPTKTTSPGLGKPRFLIADGAHGGNQHFFFLPPMVQPPDFGGAFDPTRAPVVRITQSSSLITVLTPQVDIAGQRYQTEWHTDLFDLDPSKIYRISAIVNGFELGFADVQIVSSGGELRNVDTGEYVALKDGRTLPLAFRNEQGALPSNIWLPGSPMPTPRTALGAATMGGLVYAIGGVPPTSVPLALNDVETYDPGTGLWSSAPPMLKARQGMGIAVVNETLYVFGGFSPAACGCEDQLEGSVEAYDPVNRTWSMKAAMPTPRSYFGVAVIDGVVYTIGGYAFGGPATGLQPTGVVEAYDPATNTWTSKAPMLEPRYEMGAAAVNGILYAAGGLSSSDIPTSTVESYDPLANTWSTNASMPTARSALGLVELNGTLYAIGGMGVNGVRLGTVEAYDPATDTWSARTPMSLPRLALGTAALRDVLFAIGGDPNYDAVEVYWP